MRGGDDHVHADRRGAILAGFGVLGSYLLTPERKDRHPIATWWVYEGNTFLICVGFLGFAGRAIQFNPAWGFVIFAVALAGSILTSYAYTFPKSAVGDAGSLLLLVAVALVAIGNLFTAAFSGWVTGLMLGSIVLGLPGIIAPRYRTLRYLAGGIPYSLGFIVAGVRLVLGA